MRVQLIGENAKYLARCWSECRLVDTSDDKEGVEFYPKPNSHDADALYDSYLIRLRAEAKAVGVVLALDDTALGWPTAPMALKTPLPSPNVMVPKQSFETRRPVLPSVAYSMMPPNC